MQAIRLHPNAERHLKERKEMLRLFHQYPDAIRNTQVIADACRFSLVELKYEYPEELTSEGSTPMQELELSRLGRCPLNALAKPYLKKRA